MPIGLSDGQVFKDEFELLVAHNRPLEASQKPADASSDTGSYPSSGANSEETKKPLRVVVTPKSDQDLSSSQPDPNQIGQTDVLSGEDRYQLWPEKMVRNWMGNLSTKWEGLKAVMDGKIDPLSDEGRTVIASVTTELGGAGLATAPMRTGVGLFGGRIGPVSKSLAENLEKTGVGPEKIKRLTGLERGSDGKWRIEIDDSSMQVSWLNSKPVTQKDYTAYANKDFTFQKNAGSILGMRHAKLEDILDHPELFRMYPELRKVDIILDQAYKEGGQFLNKDMLVIGNTNEPEQTLIHEIQHWIQAKEEFNLLAPNSLTNKQKDELYGYFLREKNRESLELIKELADAGRKEEAIEAADKLLKKIKEERPEYWTLAAEVEARNAETRMGLSKEERRKSLASETEDTARSEQTIGYKRVEGFGAVDKAELRSDSPGFSIEPASNKRVIPFKVEDGETVVEAAIRIGNDIYGGRLHIDAYDKARKAGVDVDKLPIESGFYTSTGRFVTREQAMEIARTRKQVTDAVPEGRKRLDALDISRQKYIDLENILHDHAAGKTSAKETQQKLKELGFTSDLRKGKYDYEVYDEKGNMFYISP